MWHSGPTPSNYFNMEFIFYAHNRGRIGLKSCAETHQTHMWELNTFTWVCVSLEIMNFSHGKRKKKSWSIFPVHSLSSSLWCGTHNLQIISIEIFLINLSKNVCTLLLCATCRPVLTSTIPSRFWHKTCYNFDFMSALASNEITSWKAFHFFSSRACAGGKENMMK